MGTESGDQRNTAYWPAFILLRQFSHKTWDHLLRGGHHPWWARPSHANQQLREFPTDTAMGQSDPVSVLMETPSPEAIPGWVRLTVKTKRHNSTWQPCDWQLLCSQVDNHDLSWTWPKRLSWTDLGSESGVVWGKRYIKQVAQPRSPWRTTLGIFLVFWLWSISFRLKQHPTFHHTLTVGSEKCSCHLLQVCGDPRNLAGLLPSWEEDHDYTIV